MNQKHNAALKHYYELRRGSWNAWAPKSTRQHKPNQRYLHAQVHREIIRLVKEGDTMAHVARVFGLNYSTVTKIIYGMNKPKRPEVSA